MVLELIPSQKCPNEDARPLGGWIVMMNVSGCEALAGYVVSNSISSECRPVDDSNEIILAFIMPKFFLE